MNKNTQQCKSINASHKNLKHAHTQFRIHKQSYFQKKKTMNALPIFVRIFWLSHEMYLTKHQIAINGSNTTIIIVIIHIHIHDTTTIIFNVDNTENNS